MSFDNLGLSPEILQALKAKGYETPSPIQEQAIPAVMQGHDVLAAAQTGTGKTAGFTLPILQLLAKGERARSNQVRTLIVTPTRELAAQVGQSVETYGKHLSLRSLVVFGGVKINPQMMRLRKGVDILVATPGRLLDLYQQNAVKFDQLEILVLDEADRMLDMGFIHDIKRLLKILPPKRQNLMFSATFSDEIRSLARGIVRDPVEISVSPPNAAAKSVKQWLHPVDKKKKAPLLIELIKENNWHQVLVFMRTKHGANKLVKQLLAANIKSLAIHGNKSQSARTKALAEFKANKIQVLVATDIAARGIDIDQLPQVVNFDLPNVPEDYVHRIGRTGRAGSEGHAVSLVAADEIKQLQDIEQLIKKHIEREYIGGFEPSHEVPASRPLKPVKAKKPKKPKKPSQHRGSSTKGAADSVKSAKKPFKKKGKATNKGKKTSDKAGARQNTNSKSSAKSSAKSSRKKDVWGKSKVAKSNENH